MITGNNMDTYAIIAKKLEKQMDIIAENQYKILKSILKLINNYKISVDEEDCDTLFDFENEHGYSTTCPLLEVFLDPIKDKIFAIGVNDFGQERSMEIKKENSGEILRFVIDNIN